MSEFLSIIIPVYNAKNFINRFYNNVKLIENAEFIFVDDGSIDDSLSILKKIEAEDTRVKVFHQVNKGPMHARNFGMGFASYSYISFMDIDDTIETKFFSCRDSWSKADILVTSYVNEKINKVVSKFKQGFYNPQEFLYLLSLNGGWELWGKIYNKKVLKDIVIPTERLKAGEDAFVFIQSLVKAKKILVIDDFFYHYFYDGGSISNQKENIFIYDNYQSCKYILENLSNQCHIDNKSIYSNLLILFFCNSVRKNCFSKHLVNFKSLFGFFSFYASLNSGIPKSKFLMFSLYYFLLRFKL